MELLEKTRALTEILNKATGADSELAEICTILAGFFDAEVRLFDKAGKIIASGKPGQTQCLVSERELFTESGLGAPVLAWLAAIERMMANVPLCRSPLCIDMLGSDVCAACKEQAVFNPVIASGERMGTLLLINRRTIGFSDQDQALIEIASSVCGSMLNYSRKNGDADSSRKINAAKNALQMLSYSELEAVCRILSELDGSEGVLVASKIAEQAGVTRSSIVSALKKLESAGVIESRSLGMKGTFIRIKNEQIMVEFQHAEA